MFDGPFANFILTAIVGLTLAGLTWMVARRSGLLPISNALVDTLQDTINVLEKQVELTQEERDKALALAKLNQEHVNALSEAIIDLATENAALRRKAGMPVRHRTAIEREVEP